jgi:predicted dehydrogenase
MPPLDTVDAGFLLSGGATGTFSMSFASTKSATEYIFIGIKGSLSITESPLETMLKLEDVAGNTIKDETVKNQAMEQEIKAFLDAVEAGDSKSRAGPEEALNDLTVIESLCSCDDKFSVLPTPFRRRIRKVVFKYMARA